MGANGRSQGPQPIEAGMLYTLHNVLSRLTLHSKHYKQ